MSEEEIDPGKEHESTTVCYCGGPKESTMLKCTVCRRFFHPGCLKSGRPSPLAGDVYFCLTCSSCSQDGQEDCQRTSISWMQTVYLALYNLVLSGSGRKGYFRWKEDICQFVERNWPLLFTKKKRSTSWCSTIAGTLSVGCPRHFKSGQQEFKETGWWALQDNVPPVEKLGGPLDDAKKRKQSHRKGSGKKKTPQKQMCEDKTSDHTSKDSTCEMLPLVKQEEFSIESLLPSDSVAIDTESDALMSSMIGEDEGELVETMALPSAFMEMDDPYTLISETNTGADQYDNSSSSSDDGGDAAAAAADDDDDGGTPDRAESVRSTARSDGQSDTPSHVVSIRSDTTTRTSRTRTNAEQETKTVIQEDRMVSITEAQEHEMLCRLNACPKSVHYDPKARRLRRKLILRKIKRDRALPLFDVDRIMTQSLKTTSGYVLDGDDVLPQKITSSDATTPADALDQKPALSSVPLFARSSRVLDRYLAAPQMLRGHRVPASASFRRLLVGVDQQAHVRPFTSPYTARVLKPYIRRDYESQPLKLKLMNELLEVTHRSDPDWCRPPSSPIDYCYVQPHLIPAVNTMCREFFWPGIDLSECLQYPDFSCVVLYRSYVIAFAFMVPDVKYNEAYISFILVHPEWRRAGIGSYMLYHLIQTCMGKDVTLHVSATNPAMLLYQKFGFKPEEFILDFYDRYLPESSTECRHAFFLRLRR